MQARIDDNDKSILYVTVKGEEFKFDLHGTVANPKVTIKRTKAEISLISTAVPQLFPVLLKAEGRINAAKERKYAELDRIGAEDKGHSNNDVF